MSPLRRVALVAAGQTRFGSHPFLGVKELFAAAVSGLPVGDLEVAYIASLSCGQGLQLGNFAPALMDYAGLGTVPAVHVENACASGGFALLQAVQAVAAGQARCALAAGVEKMRDVSGERGKYWLGISGDTEYERLAGLTFAGVFGLMTARLIHEGLCTREELARIAVKNHRYGALNPKAMLRREITVSDVLAAPMVAAPLTAYDCCPTSDGAAAVLVASEELAYQFTDRPVWVFGWGAASDTLALHSRASLTGLDAARRAGAAAYAMAGMGPADVDVAEVHDCFTVAEWVACRELGLGDGVVVNPSGGLKAKGHPIGATGVAQAVEIFQQLRGEAGARQVEGASVGLTFNMGGSGASAVVHLFRKEGG